MSEAPAVEASPQRRTGRRPGKPDTRAQILAAAEAAFRRDGFEGASVRGIARDAGVDQALVHRYFGTKRELFAAAIKLGFDPAQFVAQIAAGGAAGLGSRAVAAASAIWETPAGLALIATVRASPELTGSMAAFIHEPIATAARTVLGLSRREADLRAGLVEAQMLGLVQARFLNPREPVASFTREELVRVYGPVLQHLLTVDWGLGPRKKSSPPTQ